MEKNYIGFNSPYITGNEHDYMLDVVESGKLSGGGQYTKKCQEFFEKRYSFKKCLLTNSCTAALEMAALLLDIGPGDEVIMPSYTFVSTANAFLLRGAKIVFADSMINHPNLDVSQLESLITPRTKVIVPVHYSGVACDMDMIMDLSEKYNLFVVEDAAQAIDSFYTGRDGIKRPLGGIGHISAFSFHETKNIISGEGGLLVINDPQFSERAEILWEKGTNRCAFFRGEIDKYRWIDIGSSFLPSELTAAFLWAQLECLDDIQSKRREIWHTYYSKLESLEKQGLLRLPDIASYSANNAHIFYLVCGSLEQREKLLDTLRNNKIYAIFHYQSLHNSPYFIDKHDGRILPQSDFFSDTLIRLPLYYSLTVFEIERIVEAIKSAFKG